MELVEHVPLQELFERLSKKETIDWRRPYRVATQIGRALAFAHAHELLHGNITARHILWQSGSKSAKLTDLGMASALSGSKLRTTVMRDKLASDLPYLAPEQTQPNCFVDALCDIYSLGIVVYALMTGRLPFTGATQADIIRAI